MESLLKAEYSTIELATPIADAFPAQQLNGAANGGLVGDGFQGQENQRKGALAISSTRKKASSRKVPKASRKAYTKGMQKATIASFLPSFFFLWVSPWFSM